MPAKEGSLANCFLVALLGFIEVNDVPNSVKVLKEIVRSDGRDNRDEHIHRP